MANSEKIPIIVGVTGHRNIVDEDKAEIKARVIDSLKEIQSLCGADGGGTPIVMLNAFAQGADMLCAEAAFELGVDIVAVLPREQEQYIKSFDNIEDKNKLFDYLAKCKRIFVAPDMEKNRVWLKKHDSEMDDDSYEYRQLGIYIAEHSHVLLALWDGKPPRGSFGCGTVEVINFALRHNFLDKDHLFKPATINDSAVVWIKSRRQGDGARADVQKKWLISGSESGDGGGEYIASGDMPQCIKDVICQTVKYNVSAVDVPREPNCLWTNADELDEYRKRIRYHYAKADKLSYQKNQKQYNLFLLLIAIVGTVVAFSFLIYDDAALPFMIFPCSLAVGAVILLCRLGRKKSYHKNYIEYRALAEALRIQFYMSLCLRENDIVTNVGDLYSWAQKIDSVWIDKAVRALAVTSDVGEVRQTTTDVVEAWIGKRDGTGQLGYHERKRVSNRKNANKYQTLSAAFRMVAVVMYFVIFAFEVVALILKANNVDWFWESNIFAHVSWRNFCAIILGISAAGSLLFSSYWGKLSFDRKLEDNEKMCEFYGSAYARWNEVKMHPDVEIEKFVKEIAREEIVENGIWCSYVKDNALEVNI